MIEFFANTSVSMNVVIVLDLSLSTRPYLSEIKKAALEFVKILRPEDKCMVAGFARKLKILSEFTSDQQALNKAINKAGMLNPPGSVMIDSLYEIQTKHLEPVQGRKAIIVLTDGEVIGWKVKSRELLNAFIEGETIVYPVFYRNPRRKFPLPDAENATPEELYGTPMDYLAALALATGGKLYGASGTDFQMVFQKIANELKVQYVLGFYPERDADGKYFRSSALM